MATPRTRNVPANRSRVQSVQLDPGLAQYVQAVYVEIDNTAGADTAPTLSLSEQSGVPIAKKQQGRSVASGDVGSATWALGLEGEISSVSGDGIRFNVDNEGGWLYVQTNDCADLDTLPDPLSEGGQIGMALEDDSGCGLLIGSTSQVIVKGNGAPVDVLADGADLNLTANNSAMNVTANDGAIVVQSQDATAGAVDVSAGSNYFELRGESNANPGMLVAIADACSFAVAANTSGLANVIEMETASGAGRLGFYGATPVVQAATPTTLAQVITLLRNLGLCA